MGDTKRQRSLTDRCLIRQKISTDLEEILSVLLQSANETFLKSTSNTILDRSLSQRRELTRGPSYG